MANTINNIKSINKKLKLFYLNHFGKIIEINKKYAKPKIEMSMSVKLSLFFLRMYLIFLLLLLIYKFITLL